MKKTLLLLLTALFAVNFVANAQVSTCPITVELYETASEGWESNRLNVEYVNADNETVIEQFYVATGNIATYVINVADETQINMSLTGSGSTPYKKRSFKLLFANNIVLYSSPILEAGYTDVVENMDCSSAEREYRIINLTSNINGAGVLKWGDEVTNTINVANFTYTTITAIANPGYVFENWTLNGVIKSTSASYNLYADGDYTITANFTPIEGEYVGDHGSINSLYLPSNTYEYYSITQQIYTADEISSGVISGMGFYNDNDGTGDVRYFAIYLKATDKNVFDDNEDWISIEDATLVYDDEVDFSYANWSFISFDESFVLGENENLCVTIYDNTGDGHDVEDQYNCRVYNTKNAVNQDIYQALYIYDDDLSLDDIQDYTGTLVAKKNQIVLSYSTFNVNVSSSNNTYGTVTGGGEFAPGGSCTVEANANPGYDFVNWTINGLQESTESQYTFTVNSSVDLVANFEAHAITNHWVCEDSYLFPDFVSMIAVISIDGDIQNNTMLEVGAFHGDTVRGSGLVAQYGTRYRIFMPIYGVIGHDISFRLYDHSLSMERDDLRCEQVYHIGQLPSSVGTMGNPYEIAFNSKYDVTATVNPEGVGTVSGTGSYFLNEQVTLTAIPSVGNYVFRNWELNGEVVTSNNPYTFLVVGDMAFVANFDYQESTTLPAGYTWWSTSVETNANSFAMLKNGLSDKGMEIRAQNGAFVQYDEGEWYGTLGSINNEESYIIRTNANCNVVMTGQEADPLSHPITIHQSINNKDGFTWIGYPVSEQQSVSAAFATFTPTEEDQIWRKDGYIASYYDGVWYVNIPSIENSYMSPGLGYKYLSKSEQEKTLTYAAPSRGGSNGAEATENYYWNTNYYAYPENMSIIAIINVSDIEQRDENLELGAFVNGESRGRTKLINVNGRYYAMLMITGNNGDKVEFGLVDAENNRISMDCLNDITFEANSSVGSFNTPYEVSFTEMIDINRSKLNMYPNPVDRNSMFTLDLPVDETIKEVVITNTVGEVVRTTNSISRIEEGMPVAGVYMIKVVCHSGSVYNGKLIVK